jgi:hypothetical protein
MMKEVVVVSREQKDLFVPIDVDAVEKKKNAKFVCETCLRTADGGWSYSPVQIYWQEKPPVEGYSNYFGIFVRDGSVFITSGQSAVDEPIYAIRNDGEIGYSRYRHDYRPVGGNGVGIDGGRDYTRVIGRPDEYLTLQIEGPDLVVVESSLRPNG